MNIIDFKIFNMLKLIFSCGSCAIYFTELLNEFKTSTLLNFLFVFYFDCLYENLLVVLPLNFVLSLIDTLFYSLSWYNILIDLLGYNQASQSWNKRKAGNHYEYCLSSVVNFVMHWLDSVLCLDSHFHKQSVVSDFL